MPYSQTLWREMAILCNEKCNKCFQASWISHLGIEMGCSGRWRSHGPWRCLRMWPQCHRLGDMVVFVTGWTQWLQRCFPASLILWFCDFWLPEFRLSLWICSCSVLYTFLCAQPLSQKSCFLPIYFSFCPLFMYRVIFLPQISLCWEKQVSSYQALISSSHSNSIFCSSLIFPLLFPGYGFAWLLCRDTVSACLLLEIPHLDHCLISGNPTL